MLAEAYDKHGDEGLARLATAEYEFNIGDMRQAREFAIRARERLPKDGPDWRRATDIVLVSKPHRRRPAAAGSAQARSRRPDERR